MPWLIKEETAEKPGEELLFVHVPRCGGTSLTKYFDIGRKCRKGRSIYHRIGLTYFFYRYRLLESANYPFMTYENLYALCSILVATIVFTLVPMFHNDCFKEDVGDNVNCTPQNTAYVMWSTAMMTMTMSTFVFVAPVMGRNTTVRRIYGFLVGKLLCGFTEAENWLTGCNYVGWLLHMTAEKIIRYGYVSAEEFHRVNSFSIVRNPYSRMVSIYMYNRMGPLESFPHFVKEWQKKIKVFQETGNTDEWNIYCHVLPQYAYTHDRDGRQIVQNIIKQEDLKTMKTDKAKPYFSLLAPRVLQALHEMPHSNRRKRPKPWQEYYDAETMKIVHDMYERDFDQFGYARTIPKRSDLPESIVAGRIPRPPVGWSSWGPTYANAKRAAEESILADNTLHAPGADVTPDISLDDDDESGVELKIVSEETETATENTETNLSPHEEEKLSFCEKLRDMLTAPIRITAPVHDARTVDDLHYFVALTLRRRCLWLFILATIESIVAGTYMRTLNMECTLHDACQPVAFTIIGLTLHILALFFAALAYLEFEFAPLVLATVWTFVCSSWSFITFIFALLKWDDFPHEERNTDFKRWALAYSVIFMVYYAVYCTTYWRITLRFSQIQNQTNRMFMRHMGSTLGTLPPPDDDPPGDEETDDFDAEAGGFLALKDRPGGGTDGTKGRRNSLYTKFGRRFSSIAKKAYIF